jgi:hypothetical protein
MTPRAAANFVVPYADKELRHMKRQDWLWTFSCMRDEMRRWDVLWKSGAMTAELDARAHAAADRLADLTEALRIILGNDHTPALAVAECLPGSH